MQQNEPTLFEEICLSFETDETPIHLISIIS